jgi:4-amino-4-deoxy-L-arabinose transferase-like glycosyltransferase
LILLLQAALSAHLIWANTAYQDEALYLVTGHLEWSHWLYGTPIAQFQTYFSGAPVIYPPLGAAADALGGLAAARALSLCFMLMATAALHGVTKRLFGRSAAAFAACLFAGVGATQYLGAFATYDALALALLAGATWLGIRAVEKGPAARLILLVAAGAVLALADATKYAAALFDPAVILTVMFFAGQRHGRRAGFDAGFAMSWATIVTGGSALVLGGPSYWQGITFTTLTRAPSNSAPVAVLVVSLGWAGVAAVLAAIGATTVICSFRDRAYRALAITLALAVWLAPIEQARISTFTSLFKHVGFGEWFGAILGGFALASIAAAVPRVKVEAALRASWAAVGVSTVIGFLLASNQFTSWPNASNLVRVLRPLLKGDQHSVLAADNGNVIEYYLPQSGLASKEYFIDDQVQWQAVFANNQLVYTNPATAQAITGLGAYDLAIRRGYFTVITLSGYRTWIGADQVIQQDIRRYKDYRLVASIPYTAAGKKNTYQVWVYKGAR